MDMLTRDVEIILAAWRHRTRLEERRSTAPAQQARAFERKRQRDARAVARMVATLHKRAWEWISLPTEYRSAHRALDRLATRFDAGFASYRTGLPAGKPGAPAPAFDVIAALEAIRQRHGVSRPTIARAVVALRARLSPREQRFLGLHGADDADDAAHLSDRLRKHPSRKQSHQ